MNVFLLIVVIILIVIIIYLALNSKSIIASLNGGVPQIAGKPVVASKSSSIGTTVSPPAPSNSPSSLANSMPIEQNAFLKSLNSTPEILKKLGENPVFWGAVITQIGLEYILKQAILSLVKKFSTKAVSTVIEVGGAAALKSTGSLVVKGSEMLAAKVGTAAATKIATGVGEKAVVVATEKAAVAGAKISTEVATEAASGPVGWAVFLIQLLPMVIDLSDAFIPGGTVGYAKMGTNQQYLELKKSIDDTMTAAIKEKGVDPPLYIGPLSKLSQDELTTALKNEIANIMDFTKNPMDPLILPMITKLKDDIIAKKTDINSVNDDAVMKGYTDLIDFDLMTKKALDNICISRDGKIIKDSQGNGQCSYSSRKACDSSYKWPYVPGDGSTSVAPYTEFRNGASGTEADGYCELSAGYILRQMCEDNKIPYDSTRGTCAIDEKYCLTKGAEWGYNPHIKENDCLIPPGQEFFEFILGTTITRGLKQIFDPMQYESCKPGEFDTGYFCSKCPDTAPEESQGLCYPKCDPGYFRVGPVCWSSCPPGYKDYGVGCEKPPAYGNGGGRTPDLSPCPPGLKDDGTSCWGDLYGRGAGYAWQWGDPAFDYSRAGDRCNNENSQGCEQDGLIWYPKCKAGYHKVGCCVCETDGGAGIQKSLMDRQSCKAGQEFMFAGLCYPNCKPGFHNIGGNICSPDCPAPLIDIGATCTKKTYGTGGGTAGTDNYVKKRKVDYSSKNN